MIKPNVNSLKRVVKLADHWRNSLSRKREDTIKHKNEKQGKTKDNSKVRKIWEYTVNNFMPIFYIYFL